MCNNLCNKNTTRSLITVEYYYVSVCDWVDWED
jgi:hypothetical protein